MKPFKKVQDIIDYAIDYDGESKEFDVKNVTLTEDGVKYRPHCVTIANRDLVFFCENACLNYVIDTIGFNDYLSLVNIEE